MANVENIKKWVRALRSGDYEQARLVLADGDGFCCLGVACEVALENGVPVKRKHHVDTTFTRSGQFFEYDSQASLLPPSVMAWLGFDSNNPQVTYFGERRSLSRLNDDGAFRFAELADLIENEYVPEHMRDELVGVA